MLSRIIGNINSNPYLGFTTKLAVSLGGCLVIHSIITYTGRRFKRQNKNGEMVTGLRRQTKWYLVHTIGNAVIVALVAKDTLKTFLDPINSLNDIENYHSLSNLRSWPIVIMSSIHLYHILLYFREMTDIDWIHHLGSGGLVGSTCTFYIRGSIVNHGLMFLCGLPGGIDYGLLSLNEFGVIDRMTEKRINRYLNMYIRLPGILSNAYASIVAYLYTDIPYNPAMGLLVLFLNCWNAIYFAQRVTENYGYQVGRQSVLEHETINETTL